MEKAGKFEERDNEEIYANAVRAGKRTYFFDVKKTKADEHYLTITESKRKYNEDGTFFYQKHKVFLYREDFEKFSDALNDTLERINVLNENVPKRERNNIDQQSFSDLNFDQLDAE